MANLSVRNIDDEIVAQLRMRAAKQGLSMEEEVRRILRQAVAAPERLGDLAVELFSPAYAGPRLELPERETHDPMGFTE
ncbi:MAG: hypothetical protein WBM40_16750 [Thiohalocapsa sp.]